MRQNAVGIVWPVNGEWTVYRIARSRWRWRIQRKEEVDLAVEGAGDDRELDRARRIHQVLQKPGWRGLPLVIVLPPPLYLAVEADFPPVSAGRVHAMVPFQLERSFPFSVEDLWYGHLEPLRVDHSARVPLLAVPRTKAAPYIHALSQAGGRILGFLPLGWLWAVRVGSARPRERILLAVDGARGTEIIACEQGGLRWSTWIGSEADDAQVTAAIQEAALRLKPTQRLYQGVGEAGRRSIFEREGFSPLDEVQSPGKERDLLESLLVGWGRVGPAVLTPYGKPGYVSGGGSWKLQAALAIAVLLFLGGARYEGYDRNVTFRRQLKKRIAEIEVEVAATRALETERDALAKRDALLRRIVQRPTLSVEILKELASLLPDDTWLTELNIDNDRATLRGYSANSSHLLGLLEGTGIFKQARYGAPITTDQRMQKEIFVITAEVEGRSR